MRHNPFTLHQSAGKTVHVLQTHRDLMPQWQTQLDIHPNNNGDPALQAIKTHFQLPHHPIFMHQVHGTNSIALKAPPIKHFWHSADACYTFNKGIICAVMTADCLPVLITDTQASFVAAVHCGWRSLYQDILTRLLTKIKTVNPMVVWFGPAICKKHYQVDKAFRSHYLQSHPEAESAFTEVINNHCYASLTTLAKIQLQHYRVAHIEDCQICTFEDDRYYSWRGTKTPARQASMIWVN